MLKRTLYLLLIFSLLGVIEPARADIEAPQPVIGIIRTGIEQAKEVQEEIDSLQTEIRSAAEGIAGPIKETVNTVNDVKDQTTSAIKEGQEAVNSAKDAAQNAVKDPTSALSSQGAQIPNFLSSVDTYDTEALSSAVQKNYFMQRPKSTTTTSNNNSETTETSSSSEETTDLTELQKAQEEKMDEIMRENWARLYAAAFTSRTNLSKENQEEKNKENTRDIIQATKDKVMQMTKRFQEIVLLNAMDFEFKASQQARQFTYAEEEEDE